ncbi:hypothetical protein AO240_05265 [Pseudomonas sp. ICMP 460]|nr:hypothetical protein AO240_05265 [Pseudomonas sp. ICMP 460]
MIDGVPRELVELAAKQLVFYGRELVAQDLRALLEMPESEPCAKSQVEPSANPRACRWIANRKQSLRA